MSTVWVIRLRHQLREWCQNLWYAKIFCKRHCEGSFSCWFHISLLAFVRLLCGQNQIMSSSSFLHVTIVAIGLFFSLMHYEGNKNLSDCLTKTTRPREALLMPLCSHRIPVRWNRHGSTVSAKTSKCLYLKLFTCVMVTCTYKSTAS